MGRGYDDDALVVQLRKGVVEYAVLARLRVGPAYGLELTNDLGVRARLLGGAAVVYTLLARLRQLGFVEPSWQPSRTGPPRRYYTLTPSGLSALLAFRSTWREFVREVDRALEGDFTREANGTNRGGPADQPVSGEPAPVPSRQP